MCDRSFSVSSTGSKPTPSSLTVSDGTREERSALGDMGSQIKDLEQYAAMLDKLKERGLSEGLLSEIISMDVDSAMSYGKLPLQQSDRDFDAYNEGWGRKQELAADIASQYYKTEMDALVEQQAKAYEEAAAFMDQVAYESGESMLASLIEGMAQEEEALKVEFRKIAESAQAEMDKLGLTILASTPYNLDMPVGGTGTAEITDAVTRGLAPVIQALTEQPVPSTVQIVMPNGIEIARWLLPDIRQAEAESPLIVKDF